MKGHVFGKLIITGVNQGQGAPIVDKCFCRDAEGHRYRGFAIHLTPWRRNAYGDRLAAFALVLAWRTAPAVGTPVQPETAP